MSAAAQPAAPERPSAAGTSAFISQQPVLDAQRRVTGYRLTYAVAPRSVAGDGDGAATRLFGDILSVVGLEELVGSALAHLPLSRGLLETLGIPPVRPDRVVLRVSHELATDRDLRRILDALAGRGYALALCELPGPAFDRELLSSFGIVELDCSAWPEADLAAAVGVTLGERATPLATGLATEAAFERAKLFGFELFSGAFFASPRATEVRDVPVSSLTTLSTVAGVHGAAVEDLERVIDRDLGLSVKLLRYINSAYFGVRSEITTIRQAIMMLGARGISRWAMMVALTGGTKAPMELTTMALTRGRMCELLSAGRADVAPDEMFLIGLLSLADALLDMPLSHVLEELPLADAVRGALLEHAGTAGEILDAVISYETGDFDAQSVRAYSDKVAGAYIDSLRWARETLSGLA
jgi:EAL and modified HD-GYP domain-containing signal transduction protein